MTFAPITRWTGERRRDGRARQRVTIQRNEPITAASGQKRENWVNFCSRWPISMIATGGSEKEQDRQVKATAEWMIVLRYDAETAAITTKDRLIMEGRQLNITRCYDHSGTKREIVIRCRERE